MLPTLSDFPDNSVGKESACNGGDPGSIPESGRSPGEGIFYQLQYSWASLVAELVKNPPAMWETWVGKIPWRRERLPTPVFWSGEFHHKELDTTEWLNWTELNWKTPWTVHGILQAKILEWVAFPFSRGSSQPRDWTQVSHIAGRFSTSWATREAQEY